MLRRWVSWILFLTIVTLFAIGNAASDVNAEETFNCTDEYLSRQSASLDTYFAVKDDMVTLDNYGGCYIDDDGDLNVWYTDTQDVFEALINSHLATNQRIIYRKADYSLKQLEAYNNLLLAHMDGLGIALLSIDEYANRIQVVLYSGENREAEVISLVGDDNIIEFDYSKEGVREEATYSVHSGDQLNHQSGGYSYTYSVAVGAIHNGTYGFITCAHCVELGTTVKFCGVAMGEVTARVYGPNADVAFIQRYTTPNTFLATTLFADGTSYTPGTLDYVQGGFPSGTTVTKYGTITGHTTGTIKSTNVSVIINGVAFSHLVSANYSSASGDSGGGIKVVHSSNGLSYTYCAGIHKGRYTTVLGVDRALFTDMTIAKNALGFTGYHD